MYADDVKLYCMFSDKDSCKAFQLDINEVVEVNNLSAKTVIMHIG